MEIDVLLCDHAEVVQNKLFVNGAGIDIFYVSPQPPHVISCSIAVVAHIPYTATNQAHRVSVTLQTEDGKDVRPWVPDGQPQPDPPRLDAEFNIGRPATLSPGEEQCLSFAGSFQLPLATIGRYAFKIELDGTEERRLPFRLEARSPQMQ